MADWTPTPDQVHAVIASRPAFTATSRPGIAEVAGIIELAADSLSAEITGTLPTNLVGKARLVVSLHAAALIESTFYPEQQYGDRGPSDVLYARYQAELLGLRSLTGITATGASGLTSVPMAVARLVDRPGTVLYPTSTAGVPLNVVANGPITLP